MKNDLRENGKCKQLEQIDPGSTRKLGEIRWKSRWREEPWEYPEGFPTEIRRTTN